jgi:hypothetical protein
MSVSASSTAPALPRPRWLTAIEGIRRPDRAMLVWGLMVGCVFALVLLALVPHEWSVLGSRSTGMRDALRLLDNGGPPLAGRHGGTGPYYAIALGDDPASFTYFPLLGHLLGGVDPRVIMSYFYVFVVSVLAAVYPLVFYRLTRSLLAGYAAPLMLFGYLVSMGFIDIYWMPAWGMFALLPPLYLLARSWPRLGLVALAGICLAAGWLSSVRSSSGVGIAVIACIVLLLRRWRWWRLLPALAVLVCAYLATSTFVIAAIREQRDHRLGMTLPDDEMTQHPLYHTAYIGLGYLPNGHGIRFKDMVAAARVQHDAPGTPYFSHRYETVIRAAYVDFVKAHPLEALRQYAAKATVAIADTGPYALLALLTLPAMLLIGRGRRTRRLWALLTIPALLVGFAQPMVAIPGQGYDTQLLAVLSVLSILGVCWVLACVESVARRRGGLSFTGDELRALFAAHTGNPTGRSARLSATIVTVLVLFCIAGYFIRQSALRWQGTPTTVVTRFLGFTPNDA